MELMDVEYDARDIILNLRTCCLEVSCSMSLFIRTEVMVQVEPLLHCSPQVYTVEDWLWAAEVPAKVGIESTT